MKKAILSCSAILALLGAGCFGNAPAPAPQQPSPSSQTTGTSSVPTTPSTTTSGTTSTPAVETDFSNAIWKTYIDNQFGYSLDYPVTDASKSWSPSAGELNLSDFPKMEHRERKLTVEAKKTTSEITCGNGTEINTPNLKFCLTKSIEGAAGSTYGTYTYRSFVNGNLLTLTFVERHVTDPRVIGGCEDGTSKEPKCRPFDEAKELKIFDEIIKRANTAPVSDQLSFTTAEINQKKEKVYDVKVAFPQMDKGDAALAAFFNAAVRDPLEKQVDELVQEALQAERDKVLPPGPYTLNMDPLATYQSPRLINSFVVGSIYTGGAHPNAIYQNIIIDRVTRKSLRVSDLFKDPKQGLAFLSSTSFKALKAKEMFKDASNDDWLKTGTAAKDENFSQTHLTANGLTIVFPPYQVAAYAAGPQEVQIPWKDVQSLIKPEYLPAAK